MGLTLCGEHPGASPTLSPDTWLTGSWPSRVPSRNNSWPGGRFSAGLPGRLPAHSGAGRCVCSGSGTRARTQCGWQCFAWSQSHHAQGHRHSVCLGGKGADSVPWGHPCRGELVAPRKGRLWAEPAFSGNTQEANPGSEWHSHQSSHLGGPPAGPWGQPPAVLPAVCRAPDSCSKSLGGTVLPPVWWMRVWKQAKSQGQSAGSDE